MSQAIWRHWRNRKRRRIALQPPPSDAQRKLWAYQMHLYRIFSKQRVGQHWVDGYGNRLIGLPH